MTLSGKFAGYVIKKAAVPGFRTGYQIRARVNVVVLCRSLIEASYIPVSHSPQNTLPCRGERSGPAVCLSDHGRNKSVPSLFHQWPGHRECDGKCLPEGFASNVEPLLP